MSGNSVHNHLASWQDHLLEGYMEPRHFISGQEAKREQNQTGRGQELEAVLCATQPDTQEMCFTNLLGVSQDREIDNPN